MSGEVVRAHAVVRGRVQMVGFRAYVLRHASELGLHGTVRNRPDGTLECHLEGGREGVARMIGLMERGPSHARVDSVDVDYETPTGDLPRMTVSA
jgi:acylphosphatase